MRSRTIGPPKDSLTLRSERLGTAVTIPLSIMTTDTVRPRRTVRQPQ